MDDSTMRRALWELARAMQSDFGMVVWDDLRAPSRERWRKRAEKMLRQCPTITDALRRSEEER
jgi:hypothetical protein